jgi:hypothetical protein
MSLSYTHTHTHTHTHTEYYLVIKKNEILLFTGKWMELENIMLSEERQVQKDKGCMIFSCMDDTLDTNTNIIYTHTHTQTHTHTYTYTH